MRKYVDISSSSNVVMDKKGCAMDTALSSILGININQLKKEGM